MYRIALLTLSFLIVNAVTANSPDDKKSIERAVLDYIESQHQVKPKLMGRGLDKKLVKRTYWKTKDGSEFIMETDYETMLWIAENYNKDGDKFPPSPRIDIDILDIDNRAASVKLSVDEWIDYMHLYKNDRDEWKIINVLWQYHDNNRHVSKK
ncbi:nuclear transport factor 2 family protein [Microbulbifer sp. ANSA001]|uniref:nuclear transport factor 2 family protein n=1 Tax=Microbulbifer sp. ANSA001 TaxID=3243358 RepID=UPI004040F9D2